MPTRLSRLPILFTALLVSSVLLVGAGGCSSDPDVEGAKLYYGQQDYTRALENLNRALERDPNNVEALSLKGDVLTQQAQQEPDPVARRVVLQELVDVYTRAAAADPANEAAIRTKQLAAWGYEINQGVQDYQNAAGDTTRYIRASDAFQNSTLLAPDSTTGYFYQAITLLAANRAEQARQPLEMAIEKGETSADAYRYLASIYSATGEDQKASDLLKEAVATYPEDSELLVTYVNVLQRTNQMEEATRLYEELIATNPDDPLYHFNYGTLLLNAEDYDAAIPELEQAVELYESMGEPRPSALFNLGAAYQNKSVSVNNASLESGLPQSQVDALQAERRELLEKALPHYVQARELYEAAGESAQTVCNALFQVYAQLGRNDEAREAGECAGMDMN